MERFWSKVNKKENGCWEWTAGCVNGSYGHYRYEGKKILAHRYSFMMHHPLTIDLREHPKILVCHTCDNPKCVNPAHLWLGTNADNVRDRDAKGRNNQAKGEKNGMTKLTEQEVREIREKYAKGNIFQKELADEYGVRQSTIGFIITHKSWKHL